MYLTFEAYQNMGGTLDETTFEEYEFEARCIVDLYTYHRLNKMDPSEYPEALQRCMYALIKLIRAQWALIPGSDNDGAGGGSAQGITSQANDGVSTSYATLSAQDLLATCREEISKLIKTYLSGVLDSLGHKLLYTGIYPDE
jgi:hypothetical protein